jgi:hypothetical protein
VHQKKLQFIHGKIRNIVNGYFKFFESILFMLLILGVSGCGELADPLRPELPVKCVFRSPSEGEQFMLLLLSLEHLSDLSVGYYILQMENTSNSTITVKVTATKDNVTKDFFAELPPHQLKEFGGLNLNWYFNDGAIVTIRHTDYRTKVTRITRKL